MSAYSALWRLPEPERCATRARRDYTIYLYGPSASGFQANTNSVRRVILTPVAESLSRAQAAKYQTKCCQTPTESDLSHVSLIRPYLVYVVEPYDLHSPHHRATRGPLRQCQGLALPVPKARIPPLSRPAPRCSATRSSSPSSSRSPCMQPTRSARPAAAVSGTPPLFSNRLRTHVLTPFTEFTVEPRYAPPPQQPTRNTRYLYDRP